MDLEEPTLHYYLKVFSIFLIAFFFLFLIYFFYIINKNLSFSKNYLTIQKNESIENIITKNTVIYSKIDKTFITYYYQINKLIFNKFIHYGNFYIKKNTSLKEFLNIVTKPSNIIKKITIIEGWSNKKLNLELSKHFKDYDTIPYEDIIADTYFINQNTSFKSFVEDLKKVKIEYLNKFSNDKIYDYYSQDELMVIGSLIEKEGLDSEDKRKISSVIFNRLLKNMKLQIDATVLFALTKGEYNLNRKLLYSDLYISHPYNTYSIYGLPPKPIAYVGKKTIDIIFENYQSEYLFYFFNKSLNRHIFSKNYKTHIKRLNEYRKNQ